VRTSINASAVRIRISNEMGSSDLRIGAARIALRASGAAVVAATNLPLTFGGRGWITIPAGAPVLSDPVALAVPAFADLAVSLYLPGTAQATTIHSAAAQTSYVSTAGDHTASTSLPVQRSIGSWPFLTEVDVSPTSGSVVAVGDSITDGVGSTSNANRRWPDWLARRLQAELSSRYAVVNRGISANRLLADLSTALLAGRDALERFDRDVLATAGVRALIVFVGINDIVYSPGSNPIRADDMIAGYRQLIERSHARSIAVMGATLLPFGGHAYYTAAREGVRRTVNTWMRGAAAFDALLDADLALRDPQAPERMSANFDSGDHLHPNDAGHQAIAQAAPLPRLAAMLA
jgi:lysophospholipase L1-like esterase